MVTVRNNQIWDKPWIGRWVYMVGFQEKGQSYRHRFGRKPGKLDVTKAKKIVFLKGSRSQVSDVTEGGVSRGQRWGHWT